MYESLPDSSDYDQVFLGQVKATQKSKCREKYYLEVFVNNKKINFKLDSGADVTVISPLLVPVGQKLESTQLKLTGTDSNCLNILGQFNPSISVGNRYSNCST